MPNVKTGVDLLRLAIAPSEAEQEAAKRTHERIRGHLENDPALSGYQVRTLLQGSYRNSTNVRADSDVDMSCRTGSIFRPDVSKLATEPSYPGGLSEYDRYKAGISDGSFTFATYRADVLRSLRREFGSSAVDGNKAIKVLKNSQRLDADVLPCIEHRMYVRFTNGGESDYHRGIAFQTKQGNWIVNFPEQHYENLTSKNTETKGKLKDCIRILKRVRNAMVDDGVWKKERSPSYYLECLMWNAPSYLYDGPHADVMYAVLKYLDNDIREKQSSGTLREYVQANRKFVLFHKEFWNTTDCLEFINRVWQYIFVATK